jgi:hypothetical protein
VKLLENIIVNDCIIVKGRAEVKSITRYSTWEKMTLYKILSTQLIAFYDYHRKKIKCLRKSERIKIYTYRNKMQPKWVPCNEEWKKIFQQQMFYILCSTVNFQPQAKEISQTSFILFAFVFGALLR